MEECDLRGRDFRAGPKELDIVRQFDGTARSDGGGNAQILEQVRHLSWIAAGRSPGDDDREWSDRPGADVDDGPIHVVGVPDVLRQYLGNLGLVPVGGEGEADLSLMYSVEGFG